MEQQVVFKTRHKHNCPALFIQLIEFVADKHGHDQRYAIDPEKANKELGWDPITTFEVGIKKTIEWYLSEKGSAWLDECMKQNQEWLKKNYDNRK